MSTAQTNAESGPGTPEAGPDTAAEGRPDGSAGSGSPGSASADAVAAEDVAAEDVAAEGVVADGVVAATGGRVVVDGGEGTRPELVEAMDRVSLDQALADFAVANARVLDLTRRLTTMAEELARLKDENARLRIADGRLRELEASSAYQAVRAGRAGITLTRQFVARLRRR